MALQFRGAGDEIDRAARRIAAKERALRTTNHFNLVEIVKLLAVAGAEGLIDFVDINADRRCGVRVEFGADTDTAQREVRLRFAKGR